MPLKWFWLNKTGNARLAKFLDDDALLEDCWTIESNIQQWFKQVHIDAVAIDMACHDRRYYILHD